VGQTSLDTWTVVGNHLRVPGNPTAAVFHIGSLSVVSSYLDRVVFALMDYAMRLKLPVRESTVIQAFYFKQINEVVKDTFRFLYSMDCVRRVLSVGSHMPLHHSDYLLPLSRLRGLTAAKIAEAPNNAKFYQIVQKILLTHVHSYISPLCGYNHEEATSSGRFHSWRLQGTAVASLDLATGRSKLKKSVAEGEGDDLSLDTRGTALSASTVESKDKSFSLGFVDRMQWKRLRELALDNSILYLIIVTEKPILDYRHIPADYQPPTKLDRGETLPWAPTIGDLTTFFQFWIDWLLQFSKGNVAVARNLVLLSTSDRPYSSVIHDVATGLKINQLCMANAKTASSLPSLSPLPLEDAEVVLSGKIGSLRYVHQFSNQDYREMESVRGESSEFVVIEHFQREALVLYLIRDEITPSPLGHVRLFSARRYRWRRRRRCTEGLDARRGLFWSGADEDVVRFVEVPRDLVHRVGSCSS
jgi:hypothetical protein